MNKSLWTIRFENTANNDSGEGVVVFDDGRIVGGDSSFYFDGHYKENNGVLNITVKVTSYNNLLPSLLPYMGNSYTVMVSGNVPAPGSKSFSARSPGIKVDATHRFDL